MCVCIYRTFFLEAFGGQKGILGRCSKTADIVPSSTTNHTN